MVSFEGIARNFQQLSPFCIKSKQKVTSEQVETVVYAHFIVTMKAFLILVVCVLYVCLGGFGVCVVFLFFVFCVFSTVGLFVRNQN